MNTENSYVTKKYYLLCTCQSMKYKEAFFPHTHKNQTSIIKKFFTNVNRKVFYVLVEAKIVHKKKKKD